jgi:hypothetical protein
MDLTLGADWGRPWHGYGLFMFFMDEVLYFLMSC